MKKLLLVLTATIGCNIFGGFGQITIQSTNIANIGDILEISSDTFPSGVSIGPSGTNQTWNFASLDDDIRDTLHFQSPGPLPGSSSFPSSNMGLTDTGEDSTHLFLTRNTSGLYIDGASSFDVGVLVISDLTSTFISFPSTMGTNYTTTSSGFIFKSFIGTDPDGPGPAPMIDSLATRRTTQATSNIDSWGNVTTPIGSFPCLRQIYLERHTDSTLVFVNGSWSLVDAQTAALLGTPQIQVDSARSARWWTNNGSIKFPLVEMSYNSVGVVNEVDWLFMVGVGVEEVHSENEISVFPNPANDNITFQISDATDYSLEVFDVTGKSVYKSTFRSPTLVVSTSRYENGIYFYKIHNSDGINSSGRFIVTH